MVQKELLENHFGLFKPCSKQENFNSSPDTVILNGFTNVKVKN